MRSDSLRRPGFLQLHQDLAAAVIVTQLGVKKRSQISDTVALCLFDLAASSVFPAGSMSDGNRCAYILHPTIDIFTRLLVLSFLNTKFFLDPKVFPLSLLHLRK